MAKKTEDNVDVLDTVVEPNPEDTKRMEGRTEHFTEEELDEIIAWGKAELEKGPHIGCEKCRREDKEVPNCKCDCHIDYFPEEGDS